MFSRIFGKKQSYGNYGRFGQKNSSFTRKIIQNPRYLYKESFYSNKPNRALHSKVSQSKVSQSKVSHRSHKSRPMKYAKSRRLGTIDNSRSKYSPSIMNKIRKHRSRY